MVELIIIDNIMMEGNYGNGYEELCGLWWMNFLKCLVLWKMW